MGAQQAEITNRRGLKNEKFNKYITPRLDYVRRLVVRYTYNKSKIDDYYADVLDNFHKYILTYDPAKSIDTWIHIVVRRYVQDAVRRNKILQTDDVCVYDLSNDIMEDTQEPYHLMTPENYKDYVGDGVYEAIESLRPIYREAFLMQVSGMTLSEIADSLFESGKLKTYNIETVKSRVFLAKLQLRTLIDRYGEKRTAH